MNKTRVLLLIALYSTCCSAFYQPEQGRWMSRDPAGEALGPNLYSQVGNDSANRFDVNGLYAFDMHYYAPYFALSSSGMNSDSAWWMAYWSAMPDIDPRHAATDRAGGVAIHGPNSEAGYVQRLLHQLNGLEGDAVKKMRCCLEDLFNTSNDPTVKGYALHSFGDTYGHLVMARTYIDTGYGLSWMYSGGTEDRFYWGPLGSGHLRDWTDPDSVSLRPGLAAEYLAGLFSLVGVQRQKLTDTPTGLIQRLYPTSDISSTQGAANWADYLKNNKMALPTNWDPEKTKLPFVSPMTDRKFQDEFVTPLLKCLGKMGVSL